MTPQILPTETKEVLIAGQYTKSEWLQLSDIERREISYNRYLQNVANAPKVNYDSLILSALYEMVYYIKNGLFEAFNIIKGDVIVSVVFDQEFEISIKTPSQYFKFYDDKELVFTTLKVKTFQKLVGEKTAKLLKAELPTETVSTTNEVFEIGKSSCKKLSAIQIKTYSNPKDYLSTFSNASYPYWTVKYANDDTVYFAPVNAIDFKINLKYFNGFEFFAIESKKEKRSYITVYEKSTGFKVIESWICFLDSELTKRSQCNVEFSGLIKSAINNFPFTIEPNESIESINQKRIAQNEFYVFGTTPEVEPITETQPETAFSEISGLEKSFAKNYINAELKTRNIESLINEFETALLTCKESDKKSYYYALNELKNLTETQPETNEENEIESEPEINQEPTNQNETMQPQPTQPQTLTVGQSIQCDGYRLIVTATKKETSFDTVANFAKMNKNEELADYYTECATGDYNKQRIKVLGVLSVNDKVFNELSNNLLSSWTIANLEKFGGSESNDPRLEGVESFYKMTQQQQEIYKNTYYLLCLQVTNVETNETFYIDSQGYSYARYVGLPENIDYSQRAKVQPEYNERQPENELQKEAKQAEAQEIQEPANEPIQELSSYKQLWKVDTEGAIHLGQLSNLAYRAYLGTSMSPEKRASDCIKSYDKDLIEFLVEIPAEHQTWVKEKYISLFTSWLSAKSRCISSFIAGPSNFPVSRAQKYNNWERGAYETFIQWKEKTVKRLNRKEKVSIDLELIETENTIEQLKANQQMMKDCNKVVQSKKMGNEEKIEELENLGLSKLNATKLLTPDYCNRLGFRGFELTNNNARIKHYEEKLAKLQNRINARNEEAKETTINGVRIVENIEADRLQIFFDGIPAENIRKSLKSNGFRWSPSNGCWQSYLQSGKYKISHLVLS